MTGVQTCALPIYTQIIARLDGRYRILGETLDIGIGNMLDKFAREQGIPFPGGPRVEVLAEEWISANPDCGLSDYELPYAVQGMDLAFSGLLTAARHMVLKGKPLGAVCWSVQEHAFAACVEVAERALAHTGKNEVLLGGGVACNQRLRDMCSLMASERSAESFVPEKMYCVDNGSMIAVLGRLQHFMGRVLSQGIVPSISTSVQMKPQFCGPNRGISVQSDIRVLCGPSVEGELETSKR